jgi:pyruvate/2-oxoglutarate/acetoin dehydrogenase E1 component
MREIKYSKAIDETFKQMMEKDERIIVMGQGVDNPWFVGMSMVGLVEKFGSKRVIDSPVSENGITGIAVGAALAGLHPVVLHPRMDFMLLAMDQMVNHAAKWHYMFGGKVNVPLTIRGIINRGNEQGAQHSQSLQAMFMHAPGIKVVMPSTPYDAKGLLVASIEDDNPVLYIDDRWLYNHVGEVPKKLYSIPIGEGVVRRKGKDVTVVATSYMAFEASKAAESLEDQSIDVEVVDLRSIKPFDENLLFESVKKTGRLVIADATWKTCGVAAEISAFVVGNAFDYLKAPIVRVTLPDTPAPSSTTLEKAYYPTSDNVILAVKQIM